MKSEFNKKLEEIFGKNLWYFYDVRNGKQIKYRLKLLIDRFATDDEIAKLRDLPHVVKVKNYTWIYRGSKFDCVNVYVDCRISEIKLTK
jgi:hypothetical protein